MKSLLSLMLFLAGTALGVAQMHPPAGNVRYDDSSAYVFRDGELTTVHVTMSPAHLDEMLANPWNDVEYPCSMRFRNKVTDETKSLVTIKIRGATSRNALKKSFRLSFNEIVSGTRFHGIKKLNIIGCQNDVSIVRTKLALDQLRTFGLAAQRTALVRFTINNGGRVDDIYIATEQINDDFLKAWFGNDTGNLYQGGYKGGARADFRYVEPGDASTYQSLGNGETYVEENNEDSPDYTDLADLIRFINHSSDQDFQRDLPGKFNVDGFLRAMAADIVVGNWDNVWYGANNWFLYHNPETDRFEWIPYDYDNTFGIDFFGVDWARRSLTGWGSGGFGSNPDISPLVRRVLAVPSWEEQLRRYIMEFVGGSTMPAPITFPDPANDTFLGTSEPHFDILRTVVTHDSRNVIFTVHVAGPIDVGGTTNQARFILFFDTAPGGLTSNPWGRDIQSTIACDYFLGAWTDSGGGFLGYRAKDGTWTADTSASNPKGISVSLARKNDGMVQITIPRSVLGVLAGGTFAFDIATTNDRGASMEPGIDHLSNPVLATPGYDAPSTPGRFLSYTLRGAVPFDTMVPFSLEALGSKVDRLRSLATPFAYQGPMSGGSMDWGWTPDDFLVSFDQPTYYQSPGRPWNWGIKPFISVRSSYLRATVPLPRALSGLCVNEVLSVNNGVNRDESGVFEAWVELYNSDDVDVDAGGMYLSNTPLDVRKWRIPDGTIVPARGFRLFWTDNQPEQGDNHASFPLSIWGQTVGLYDRDANANLLVSSLQVPVSVPNVSYGRFPDGSRHLLSFQTPTPGAPNTNVRTWTYLDAVDSLRTAGGLELSLDQDANEDGRVDVLDTVLILRSLSGL